MNKQLSELFIIASAGVPTFEAAVLGAYIHGKAAEKLVAKGVSSASVLASDLIELRF
jgi:NAD(P)H-hydrate repair Nnr-like enzyme with NAD(P)H-hydrate dehydratase domain